MAFGEPPGCDHMPTADNQSRFRARFGSQGSRYQTNPIPAKTAPKIPQTLLAKLLWSAPDQSGAGQEEIK